MEPIAKAGGGIFHESRYWKEEYYIIPDDRYTQKEVESMTLEEYEQKCASLPTLTYNPGKQFISLEKQRELKGTQLELVNIQVRRVVDLISRALTNKMETTKGVTKDLQVIKGYRNIRVRINISDLSGENIGLIVRRLNNYGLQVCTSYYTDSHILHHSDAAKWLNGTTPATRLNIFGVLDQHHIESFENTRRTNGGYETKDNKAKLIVIMYLLKLLGEDSGIIEESNVKELRKQIEYAEGISEYYDEHELLQLAKTCIEEIGVEFDERGYNIYKLRDIDFDKLKILEDKLSDIVYNWNSKTQDINKENQFAILEHNIRHYLFNFINSILVIQKKFLNDVDNVVYRKAHKLERYEWTELELPKLFRTKAIFERINDIFYKSHPNYELAEEDWIVTPNYSRIRIRLSRAEYLEQIKRVDAGTSLFRLAKINL
jgi:hypothetical protein